MIYIVHSVVRKLQDSLTGSGRGSGFFKFRSFHDGTLKLLGARLFTTNCFSLLQHIVKILNSHVQ